MARPRFAAGRGDRIAVVGRNGAGKSSLLRCLAGVQAPSAGSVELGANVALGYFAQEHEQIDLEASSLSNLDDEVLETDAEAHEPRRHTSGELLIGIQLRVRR